MENARSVKRRKLYRGIRNEEENNLYELWWQLKASFNDSNKFQFRMVCLCALFTYVTWYLLHYFNSMSFLWHTLQPFSFSSSAVNFFITSFWIAFEILPTVLEVIERWHSDVAHDHHEHKNSIASRSENMASY